MGNLNTDLLTQFTEETNLIPTYIKDGSTYHTLKYVNWLESKIDAANSNALEDTPPPRKVGNTFKGVSSVSWKETSSIQVPDVQHIPLQYIREKVTQEPDKVAIREALESGVKIEGCSIVTKKINRGNNKQGELN